MSYITWFYSDTFSIGKVNLGYKSTSSTAFTDLVTLFSLMYKVLNSSHPMCHPQHISEEDMIYVVHIVGCQFSNLFDPVCKKMKF